MMFSFRGILQICIILISFRDTNDLVNLGICKFEFKLTCSGRFTLTLLWAILKTLQYGEALTPPPPNFVVSGSITIPVGLVYL